MIQNLTLLDINMPQLLLIYDRRMYIDIEIFCSCDCFHLVTHFQKLKFFLFFETASLYLVYCLLIVYARCRFQKHKFFYFLKVKTMYRQPDSLLNFRKKVKKFAFDHCKTCSEHYEELAQEQNIALANFRRKKLSQTGIRGSNGNIKYLTFDEASYLAKVSRSMINKWADKGKFTVIKVGSRVRIRRDEFEDWMEQRDLERSMQ